MNNKKNTDANCDYIDDDQDVVSAVLLLLFWLTSQFILFYTPYGSKRLEFSISLVHI